MHADVQPILIANVMFICPCEALQQLLEQLEAQKGSGGNLSKAIDHFCKITQSFTPVLFPLTFQLWEGLYLLQRRRRFQS
jgi:hypothetical protein